jgi:hypothetical protein
VNQEQKPKKKSMGDLAGEPTRKAKVFSPSAPKLKDEFPTLLQSPASEDPSSESKDSKRSTSVPIPNCLVTFPYSTLSIFSTLLAETQPSVG